MKYNFLISITVGLAALVFGLGCQSTPKIVPAPESPKQNVVDTYHGVKVNDPFRWLEEKKNPKVKTWSRAQTKVTRKYLDQLPSRSFYNDRVKEIIQEQGVTYYGLTPLKKGYLLGKVQPPKKQPFLIYVDSPYDISKQKVIYDPNVEAPDGSLILEFAEPSPNSKYLAISVSKAGTEVGDLIFIDLKTGKKLKDFIPRVNGPTAGGSVAWLNDSEILYTRYPSPKERPEKDKFFYQQVYRHKIGSSKDQYELGKQLNRMSAIKLSKAPDSSNMLATVQYGDSGRFSYYLKSGKGKWKKIISESSEIKGAVWGYSGNLFYVSFKGTEKGKVLKASAKRPFVKQAKTIIKPNKDVVIADFYRGGYIATTPNSIAVRYQMGGPSEIKIFNYNGKMQAKPKTPAVSSVSYVLSHPNKKDFFVPIRSYTQPTAYYQLSAKTGELRKTQVKKDPKDLFSGVKVIREMATSKDGTKVPVNILLPKGYSKADGPRPLILYGYGGYGVNLEPGSRSTWSAWLERGYIFAVANIRGGGEYGKKWHDQGRVTKKQNCFDDFYGVSRYLIKNKYTTKDTLGIMGGSNGGLLMGAVTTQHPEDFGAVVGMVGVYDSLRTELTPNGAFNIPEFGTVKKKDEFKALFAYSPYHNAKQASYPPILLTTGENDNRVDSMNSKKMAAQLQTNNQSKNPILLRVDEGTGHGQGTPLDMKVKQQTDIYSFFEYMLTKSS